MTESADHTATETSGVSSNGVGDVRVSASSPTDSSTTAIAIGSMESINVTVNGTEAINGINSNTNTATLMVPPAASPSLPTSALSLGAPSASPPLFGHHLSAPPSTFDSSSHFLAESPAIGQRTLMPPNHDDAPLLSPGMSTSQLQASPFGSPSGLSPGMFLPGIDDSAKSISRYRVLQTNTNGAANQSDTQSSNNSSDLHLLSTPSLPSSTLFTPGPQYQSLGMGSPAMGIMSRFDSSPGATLRSLRMTPNSTNMVMPLPSPPSSSTTLGRSGLPPLAPQPAQGGGSFQSSNTNSNNNILNPTPLQPSGGLSSSQTPSAQQSSQAPLLPPAPLSQSTVSMDAFPNQNLNQSPQSPPAMAQSAAMNSSQQLANSLQQTKQLMQALSNVQAQSQQQQQQHLQSQQQVTQLQLQLQLQMQLSQQLQQQLQLQQQQIAANAAHSYPPLPNQPFPSGGSPNQFNNNMPQQMPNGTAPGGYQQGSPTMPTKTLSGGAPNNPVYHDMNMNHIPPSYQNAYANFTNEMNNNFNPNVPSPNSGNHHLNMSMNMNKQQVQNPAYGQPVLASMKPKVQSPNNGAVVPATTVAVVKAEKVKTPLKSEKVKDFPEKSGDPSSMPATSTPTNPPSKKRERSTSEPATGDAGDDSGDDSEDEDSDSDKEDAEDDGPPELDADGNPIPRKKKVAGSSCHQCKTRRVGDELIYCGMSHAKKGRAKKRKAERKCRKKYCSRCLHKFYHEAPPPKPAPGEPNTWSCPGCRGLCTCAACKRTQQRREAKRKKQLAAQQGHPIAHVAHAHHVVPGHPQAAYAMPHHPHMPNPMMHQGGAPGGYDNMSMQQMPYGHSGHMPMQDYNNPNMSPNTMNPQGNMRGPPMQGGTHMNSGINSPPMYHPQQQSQMHPPNHHYSQPPINSPPQMTHSLFNNHNNANGPSNGNNPAYSPQGYMHQSYPSPSFQQPSHLLSPNGLGYRTLGPQPTGNNNMPFVPTPTLPTHSLQAYGNSNGPSANGGSVNKLAAPMPSPPMTYSSLALSPQGIQTRGLPPTVTQMGMPNMPSILHSHGSDGAQQHNASQQPTPAAIGVAVAAANNIQRPDLL